MRAEPRVIAKASKTQASQEEAPKMGSAAMPAVNGAISGFWRVFRQNDPSSGISIRRRVPVQGIYTWLIAGIEGEGEHENEGVSEDLYTLMSGATGD